MFSAHFETWTSSLSHIGIQYRRIMQQGVSDCSGMREADKKKKKKKKGMQDMVA